MDDAVPKHRPANTGRKTGLLVGLSISFVLHLLLLYWLHASHNAYIEELSAIPKQEQTVVQLALPPKPESPPEPEPLPPPLPEPALEPELEVIEPVKEPPPEKIAQENPPVEVLQQLVEPKPEVKPPPSKVNRTIAAALEGRRPDFSKPFLKRNGQKPTADGISDDIWGMNPRLQEQFERAKAREIARREHKEKINKLSARSLFDGSNKVITNIDANGVQYSRTGSAEPAHWFFAQFMGAGGETCIKIQHHPDGSETSTIVSCDELRRLAKDNSIEIYIHPSLRTRQEQFKYWKKEEKTLEEKFIDKLMESLPPFPEPGESITTHSDLDTLFSGEALPMESVEEEETQQ